MSFDVTKALKKSTTRAKSDVANKLVSMFLHDVSRKVCIAGGMAVSDPRYAEAVITAFGKSCLYCSGELEADRATVEHLNGMNRVSLGLHVPGNVAMACKACNNGKRQDDQHLPLANNGWESFLSHDGTRCDSGCKACAHWIRIWPDTNVRQESLAAARERILQFQKPFNHYVHWSAAAREELGGKIETLYRDCQRFATDEIAKLGSGLKLQLPAANEELGTDPQR